MNITEFDNNILMDFYANNGLEFSNEQGYFGNEVKSFAIIDNEKIIGAVSISIYKNKNFIEAIAVEKNNRDKGYGNKLLRFALQNLEKPVYTISKADEFYLKNGFIYDNADLIGEECKNCNEYNVNCFPKVVVYK